MKPLQTKSISKLVLTFLLFNFMSCDAQNDIKNNKIIALNELIQIFYQLTDIDLEQLDQRKKTTGDDHFEKLKNSISKENLNTKTIQLFNQYFSDKEIDDLYLDTKKAAAQHQNRNLLDPEPNQFKSNLSSELKIKKDTIYPKLFDEGYTAFQNFKQQLYVLDSINYDITASKNKARASHKAYNTPNGIYEALSFAENQNKEDYLKSITIKDLPGVPLTYTNLKKLTITPQQGSGLFYSIQIIFNNEDSKALSVLSTNNIGKPLVIIIDKKIVMAPFLMSAIDNGELSISGNMSYNKARTMVDNIKNSQ
ncbi:SecDF P1 head subdomain-containing protein [Psychroserpens sp. NJDZ02]|uniref:SecDF P1 head subdomain-containing protein n=1 Tax=Psychroserpens sp. NJDZ02 TaxID=2570561 RepID=UPI0010A89BE5|nr:hypothetical protein [Psychroserpens sp. NJDZ02]QCE40977.1 hypothetical protein E9099_05945 [Psychroserpens sp. NJDZ02]